MKSSEENEQMSHMFLLEHRFNSLTEFLASQILYAIYFITLNMSHWTVSLKFTVNMLLFEQFHRALFETILSLYSKRDWNNFFYDDSDS